MADNEDPNKPPSRAPAIEQLGRYAGLLVRHARPGLERFVRFAKPRAEKAARDAVQYASENKDELKQAATHVALTRVPAPLRSVIGAMTRGDDAQASRSAQQAELTCPSCGVRSHLNARFCSECGSKLT